YWVELGLADNAGNPVSRNVYWLSTQTDVVDWEKTFWQHTPQAQFADFTALQDLAGATVELSAQSTSEMARGTTMVTLRNTSPGNVPAIGLHASIVRGDPAPGHYDEPIAPVRWDDNDVTLFGGQSVTLTAR